MRAGTTREINDRFIAWNGLQLHIAKTWDCRVSGQRHLVFEKDFRPLLQIRWESAAHHSAGKLQKRVNRCASELGEVIAEESLPIELQQLGESFDQATCFRQENGIIKGGICLCADCRTLVLFQILATNPALVNEVIAHLSTLSCCCHTHNLWRVQDFTLTLPVSYTLKDYTFAAGLTRLSFLRGDLLLQTCTLGPADIRLKRQSLKDILTVLTDAPRLQITTGENGNFYEGFRSPTIAQQIRYRLRRERPFIRAAIRHDIDTNRLLAILLSAKRPIAPTTPHEIFQHYEIIRQ